MTNDPLTQNQITELITGRKALLDSLRPEISRKLLYSLEEKISADEKALNQILDWQEGRSSQMSKYTFILNSNYFEQEFL